MAWGIDDITKALSFGQDLNTPQGADRFSYMAGNMGKILSGADTPMGQVGGFAAQMGGAGEQERSIKSILDMLRGMPMTAPDQEGITAQKVLPSGALSFEITPPMKPIAEGGDVTPSVKSDNKTGGAVTTPFNQAEKPMFQVSPLTQSLLKLFGR